MYVKRIMTLLRDLKVVYANTAIREVVEIMLSNGLTELPVVDKKNLFQGEISMRDILREALPRYIADGNLKDVSFAPGLFKFEDKLKDIMYKEVSAVMDLRFQPFLQFQNIKMILSMLLRRTEGWLVQY